MADKLIIFDTTLRDGEQSPGASMTKEEKLRIARQLEKLRVDVIEAGFAASSNGDFEAVKAIADAIRDSTVCSLARANDRDISRAAEALGNARRRRIHTFIATSALHMDKKLRMSPEQVFDQARLSVRFARKFTDDVEFSPEDASRSDLDFLCRVLESAIAEGATTINIPDTVGYTTPEEYRDLFRRVRATVPNADKAVFSVHCHNDLGMAVANSLAGVEGGARQIECTINGIGERAGNAAMEEIVMALATRRDIYGAQTGILTTELVRASKLLSRITGVNVQPNKAIVGRNAFAHSSGIHQDGVLKNRENYEIIDPKEVGIKESAIILTARSGRAALNHRLQLLGFNLDKEELDEIYHRFLILADKKKEVNDEDIRILTGEVFQGEKSLKLELLQVTCGKSTIPVATVGLKINGEVHTSTASGNGPIDAAFTAVKQLISKTIHLEEFLVQAITKGSNDFGKVHIQVEHEQKTYYGFGTNTDIVTASVEAFIDAISKIQ